MTTFVLVPGGWHGAYSWQPTVDLLVAQGHEVRALTLDGLGPDRPPHVPDPNLDDHIAQTSDGFRRLFVTGAAGDGRTVAVPPGLDPRARPHPVASFLQAVRLTGAIDRIARRTAVFATNFPDTPFAELRRRLRSDPAWEVHDLPVGHAVPRLAPAALTEILTSAGPAPSTAVEPLDIPR